MEWYHTYDKLERLIGSCTSSCSLLYNNLEQYMAVLDSRHVLGMLTKLNSCMFDIFERSLCTTIHFYGNPIKCGNIYFDSNISKTLLFLQQFKRHSTLLLPETSQRP